MTQPITVLVVDDDPDVVEQLTIILQGEGYRVVAGSSQREGEDLLLSTQPDVAIVDLMMEQMDGGFTLCHHIKKKDATIPVILVTGVAAETGLEFDSSTREERSWVKADAMLAKPVRFDQLRAQIEHLLKGKAQA